jgi:hypothetical protein
MELNYLYIDYSIDQWQWDEMWTHNTGHACQDMSESRSRSSRLELGSENRIAAAVDFERTTTTTTPAADRECPTQLDHIVTEVEIDSYDKRMLELADHLRQTEEPRSWIARADIPKR